MPGPSSNQDIFDVRKIRRLVELMKDHDLSEIDLRQGETRIQLRRAGGPAAVGIEAPAADSASAGPRPRWPGQPQGHPSRKPPRQTSRNTWC